MKVLLFWWVHWWREQISPKTRIVQRLFMLIAVLSLFINATTVHAAIELERTSIGSYVGATVTWRVIASGDSKVEIKKLSDSSLSESFFLKDLSYSSPSNDNLKCSFLSITKTPELQCSFKKAGIYTVKISYGSDAKEIVQIVSPNPPPAFDTNFETLVSTGCSKPDYQVIVVDGTSAGIGAALAAADMGLSTCLLEPTSLLGGMFTNGIGITDIGVDWLSGTNRAVLSGLSYGLLEEFRKEVQKLRPQGDLNDTTKGLDFRPSWSRQALYNLLTKRVDKGMLHIALNSEFKSINRRTTDNKFEVNGKYIGSYIIDATDSGDVAVYLKYGSNQVPETDLKNAWNSPYCSALNNTNTNAATVTGLVDATATGEAPFFCVRNPPQAYSFVMTIKEYGAEKNWSYMTDAPPNCNTNGINTGIEGEYAPNLHSRIPDGAPDDANPTQPTWTYATGNLGKENSISVNQVKHHAGLGTYDISLAYPKGTCPNSDSSKYVKLGDELIDCDTHGFGLKTGYANYPDNRPAILERYLNHSMCLLYHAQHDSHNKNVGLTESEDPLRGNFPARLYVREGRRINGEATFYGEDALIFNGKAIGYPKEAPEDPVTKQLIITKTEDFLQDNHRPKQSFLTTYQSIGFTSYTMDTHGTSPASGADGTYLGDYTGVGMIPLGVMIPKDTALSNVLVPLAVSSSAWGYSTLRMDPTRLYMGEVAALAIKTFIDEKQSNSLQRLSDILSNPQILTSMQDKLINERHAKIFLCQDVKSKFEQTALEHVFGTVPKQIDGLHYLKDKDGKPIPSVPIAYDDSLNTAVQFLGAWQIAQGYPNYLCRPNEKITRAEFTKIAMLSSDLAEYFRDSSKGYKGTDKYVDSNGASIKKTACFTDDKSSKNYVGMIGIDDKHHWGMGYICAAKEAGVIKGLSATQFGPNNNTTLANALKIVLLGILEPQTEGTFLDNMPEKYLTGYWGKPYLTKAVDNYKDIFQLPKELLSAKNMDDDTSIKKYLEQEITREYMALITYNAIKSKLDKLKGSSSSTISVQ